MIVISISFLEFKHTLQALSQIPINALPKDEVLRIISSLIMVNVPQKFLNIITNKHVMSPLEKTFPQTSSYTQVKSLPLNIDKNIPKTFYYSQKKFSFTKEPLIGVNDSTIVTSPTDNYIPEYSKNCKLQSSFTMSSPTNIDDAMVLSDHQTNDLR